MSRELFEEVLRENGAILQKSVNSETQLLIALDKPSQQKIAKAHELGIPVIYLDDIRFDNFNKQ